MVFISGFLGIEKTSDGFVKPKTGWAVAEKIVNEKQEQDVHYGADEESDSNESEEGQNEEN